MKCQDRTLLDDGLALRQQVTKTFINTKNHSGSEFMTTNNQNVLKITKSLKLL